MYQVYVVVALFGGGRNHEPRKHPTIKSCTAVVLLAVLEKLL